jgi:hypothetical protein
MQRRHSLIWVALAASACGDDSASATNADADTSSTSNSTFTSTTSEPSSSTTSDIEDTTTETGTQPDTGVDTMDTTDTETGGPDDGLWPAACTPVVIGSVCQGDGGVCGDGVLQSCEVCGGTKDEGGDTDTSPPQCEITSEPCDAENLDGQTCSSLGFAGGDLTCDEWCGFDIRDCGSCLASPQVIECRQPRVDVVSVHDLELATDGETIAAAWIGDRLLSFARFDDQFEPLGTTPCIELDDGHRLALARVPDGWWVAVGGTGENPAVVLHRFADDGMLAQTLRTIADATNPIFVQRPDGWPLLIYEHTDFAAAFSTEVVAEQLEDDGAAAWQTSLGTAFWQDQTSAAASGDGTLVAVRSTEGTEDTLVIPLAADGTIGAGQIVDGAYGLELATTADGVAGVWRGPDGWVWGRFDGAGSLVTAEVTVGPHDPTTATQESVVVGTGGRSIAAVTQSQRTELEAVHIADDGSTAVDAYTVAIEPTELNEIEGIAFGEDVVLGWISYSQHPSRARFVLARLDP